MATERKHSETRQRTHLVCVRMNPEESGLLKAEAARTGASEASLLRDAFLASLGANNNEENPHGT
jgi:hypothetical protein